MATGILPIIGLALSAVGVGVQMKAAGDAADASRDAEEARKKQMNLDATRRRRAAVRESIIARGMATNTAASQGASEGSAIKGALAQISGNASESIGNINQNVQLGNAIYDANGRRIKAESLAGIGSGLVSFGNMFSSSGDKLMKLPEGLAGLYD
jgi:hypothetical protein